MDSRNSISKILNRLENEMPMVEKGDIIETIKTIYPSLKTPKEERNIIFEGVEMTMPLASSKESKMLLSKDSQRKFCEYLSDELFYNTLVLLYSRNYEWYYKGGYP